MRLILASLAATVLLSGTVQAQDAPARAPIVGGWSASTVTPQVSSAATFALAELKLPAESLDRIEKVERQVVAGMNYRFVLVLKDKRKLSVTVWSKLDGSHELTESKEIHAH
ncbi:MAG: cystatin domain-containing protein [Pseudomonadota bacterium]